MNQKTSALRLYGALKTSALHSPCHLSSYKPSGSLLSDDYAMLMNPNKNGTGVNGYPWPNHCPCDLAVCMPKVGVRF